MDNNITELLQEADALLEEADCLLDNLSDCDDEILNEAEPFLEERERYISLRGEEYRELIRESDEGVPITTISDYSNQLIGVIRELFRLAKNRNTIFSKQKHKQVLNDDHARLIQGWAKLKQGDYDEEFIKKVLESKGSETEKNGNKKH